jgi:rhamnosyltransferase
VWKVSADQKDSTIARAEIAVVVVTYHPASDVESRLEKMAAQGGSLLVVDNGSAEDGGGLREICDRHAWELIANPANLGLGAALNQGVRRMAERGARWVLLFDQDSEPAPDMSDEMIETLQRHPAHEHVAVIGPSFQDPDTGRCHRVLRQHPRWPWLFQKVQNAGDDLSAVSMVVTSGSLVRVAAFWEVGPFDEAFFIDYVDTDFCLRCRAAGRLIAVSAGARLNHQLGRREQREFLGLAFYPTNHPPLRHYYIARNRVIMLRRHGLRFPHWMFFDLAAAGLWLFRVLAFEQAKGTKLKAMILGTWDGLRGRFGPCAARRIAMLSS